MNRLLLILCLFINTKVFCCNCSGPINSLKTDIESSYAIFIGVIDKINLEQTFHQNDGIGTGLKYINFDVISTSKGLNQAQLKVTLFDKMSNSSCEGIYYGKSVGDTVLVFADQISDRLLGSYLCGRHPTIAKLSAEEKIYIDTAKWFNPKEYYEDAEAFIENKFGSNQDDEKIKPEDENESSKAELSFLLYFSLGLNLLLIIWIVYKTNKKAL